MYSPALCEAASYLRSAGRSMNGKISFLGRGSSAGLAQETVLNLVGSLSCIALLGRLVERRGGAIFCTKDADLL
jgi:hypothetical protein